MSETKKLPRALSDVIVEARAAEANVGEVSDFSEDQLGQHQASNCKVTLYRTFGDWEIDIRLPSGACFGFDVPVGSIVGKHKDGSDWRF